MRYRKEEEEAEEMGVENWSWAIQCNQQRKKDKEMGKTVMRYEGNKLFVCQCQTTSKVGKEKVI